MKDAFKKGFGTILGMYCGALLVGVITELVKSNKEVAKEDKTEEDSKEEKESN